MIKVQGRTRNILLVAGFLVVLFLVWYFSAIVTYVLISAVLSLVGRPVVRFFHSANLGRFSISNSVSAFLTLFIFWVFFIGSFRFLIPLLINEFEQLSTIDFNAVVEVFENPIRRWTEFFGEDTAPENDARLMALLKTQFGDRLNFSQLTDVFGFVAGTLGEVFITFFAVSFITFFFLKEENMFRDSILLVIPSDYEDKVSRILSSIYNLLRRYFVGLLFEITMVGLLVTLGLAIVGIDFSHAVVIGLFCGLFNVIPYLGPWMGAIVGLLIGVAINLNADFMGYTLPLLGLMLLVFVVVQVIDNILFQPLIYSSSVKAHPLEIFLVIMAAGSVAGILGMILAIPAYTIVRVIAKEFLDNLKIVRKLTENLD
ncbi:AI-2E family transporter [uncultured Sunxiuqinia sp.]|uniref:AI-2E family transporter n=1 Tax=uncultured Sunxiuqinia sp. TaxID=1573825 RepID=UPI0030DC1A04|tara:strand:- start:62532 stop:63644 length:1113 start_codon:yes stop_codon:yes gene_type:complete